MRLKRVQNVYIKKTHYKQETAFSCIPACVRMVLEFHSIVMREAELRAKFKTKSYGTHIVNLLNLNHESYGIQTKIDFWSIAELKEFLQKFQTPCITLIRTEFLKHWESKCSHAVVVVGFDDEHIIVNDPYFDEKEFRIPFDDFTNAWQINDGVVITIVAE